jgi:hypothetical protein
MSTTAQVKFIIYNRLARFTQFVIQKFQMGVTVYSPLVLCRERCGIHPGRVPTCQHHDVRCRQCTATASVFEGELQQIWLLAHSGPTS